MQGIYLGVEMYEMPMFINLLVVGLGLKISQQNYLGNMHERKGKRSVTIKINVNSNGMLSQIWDIFNIFWSGL